jgi:hypothetical protein
MTRLTREDKDEKSIDEADAIARTRHYRFFDCGGSLFSVAGGGC